MTGSQLLSRLETAKEQLRSAGYLELTELLEPAAGEDAVRAVEERLNVRFPEPLRSFWTECANLYGYYVNLSDEGREAFDADPSAAQLEIVRVTTLTRKTRGGRELIRFTNDGWGNGWALDVSLTPDEGGDIVWLRHDGPEDEAVSDRRASLEALFDDLEQTYFLTGEIGEILEERMPRPTRRRPTGRTIAPKASVRPSAPEPEAAPRRTKKRTAKTKKIAKKPTHSSKKSMKKKVGRAKPAPKKAVKKKMQTRPSKKKKRAAKTKRRR